MPIKSKITPISGRITAPPIRGTYQIYVDGSTMAKNLASGDYDPLICIRELDTGETIIARDVSWNGPTRFVQRKLPLPDTDVHYWIETDAPITVCRDNEPFYIVSGNTAAKPCFGPEFGHIIVNLDVPLLRKQQQDGIERFLVAVRQAKKPEETVWGREAFWNGPTRILHRLTSPLPGTKGRGSAYVETDTPVTVMMAGAKSPVTIQP